MNSRDPTNYGSPSRDTEGKPADHSDKDTHSSPLSSRPAEAQTHPRCQHKNVTCHIKRDYLDYLTLGVEVLGLIGLFVYACFTYGILRAGNRSADAAHDSAVAAQSAATTAGQALADSTKNFKIDERPYQVPDGVPKFDPPLPSDLSAPADLTLHNIGHTPSLDVVNFAAMKKLVFATKLSQERFVAEVNREFSRILDDESKLETPIGKYVDKTDVAPGGPQFISRNLAEKDRLTPDESRELLSDDSKTIVLFMGVSSYKGFDRTEKYRTEFCYFFFGQNQTIWHFCPVHNLVQ